MKAVIVRRRPGITATSWLSLKFCLGAKQGKPQELLVWDLSCGRCDQVKISGFKSQKKPQESGDWMSLPTSSEEKKLFIFKHTDRYIYIYCTTNQQELFSQGLKWTGSDHRNR